MKDENSKAYTFGRKEKKKFKLYTILHLNAQLLGSNSEIM